MVFFSEKTRILSQKNKKNGKNQNRARFTTIFNDS